MLILGLTGTIASGKSTASDYLRSHHHVTIIDADVIAREVVQVGERAYKKIVLEFEPKIKDLLLPDKSLNRAALGKHVFENKQDLQRLNKIVHPAVRRRMLMLLLKSFFTFDPMVVLDIPLLFESKLNRICGKCLVISSVTEHQLERLLVRNPEMSREDGLNRIGAQMPTEEKVKLADLVVKNDSSKQDLYDQLDEVVEKVKPRIFWTYLSVFSPSILLLCFFLLW